MLLIYQSSDFDSANLSKISAYFIMECLIKYIET